MPHAFEIDNLVTRFEPQVGAIDGLAATVRRLSDLQGCFSDTAAYDMALAQGDPLIYTVTAVEPAMGLGALHYGAGRIMPGSIGGEYYMTKGHLHEWRSAAEFYIGLSGEGCLLLEHEETGESRMVPLLPNTAVYVPGRTAHRTVNTGAVPLTYLGVYPADAGHDYSSICNRNFRYTVMSVNGKPEMRLRNGIR